MDLVGQTAGYVAGRQPAPKKGGGGGGFMSHLNPLQFANKIPGLGGGAGELGATGGGIAPLAEEAAPLLLL